LQWLAKNPKLVTRVIKIGYKGTKWGYNEALRNYGRSVLWARSIGILICLFIITLCTPFGRLFKRRPQATLERDKTGSKRWNWKRLSVFCLSGLVVSAIYSALHTPIEINSMSEQPKNGFASAARCTREIRIHLQEDDDPDPNDHFQNQIIAPLIRAADGSQWLICSTEDLGFKWPEINDGDISMISYICSRRGPGPASAETPELLYCYGPYPRLCLIPCPESIQSELARPPVSLTSLADRRPLYYLPADHGVRGISVQQYTISKTALALDIQRPDGKTVRFGDFLLDSDGALAGFFNSHRTLLAIKPDFHKHLVQIVRPRLVNNSGYHQQFVEDVKSLP
jgi:hypothetical protein